MVASDYVAMSGLARAIRLSKARFPTLRIDLLPLTMASTKLVALGEVDLLFAGQVLDVELPPNRMVFEDRFTCVVCKECGPGGEEMTADQYLSGQHIVLRYFEHQMTFEDEEALRRQGVIRERQISVWSHSLIPPLLCGTDMIATVAERAASDIAGRWPLRIVPFPFDQEPVRVFAYWHNSRNEDHILSEFLGMFHEVLNGDTASGNGLRSDA